MDETDILIKDIQNTFGSIYPIYNKIGKYAYEEAVERTTFNELRNIYHTAYQKVYDLNRSTRDLESIPEDIVYDSGVSYTSLKKMLIESRWYDINTFHNAFQFIHMVGRIKYWNELESLDILLQANEAELSVEFDNPRRVHNWIWIRNKKPATDWRNERLTIELPEVIMRAKILTANYITLDTLSRQKIYISDYFSGTVYDLLNVIRQHFPACTHFRVKRIPFNGLDMIADRF